MLGVPLPWNMRSTRLLNFIDSVPRRRKVVCCPTRPTVPRWEEQLRFLALSPDLEHQEITWFWFLVEKASPEIPRNQ